MSKKILFLVTALDSASGICVQKVAAELAGRDCEVHILTKSAEASGWGYETSYGAVVYAMPPAGMEKLLTKQGTPFHNFIKRIAVFLDRVQVVLCYPVWPVYRPCFLSRFVSKARELAREHNVDAVIPVYNTIDALIAADAIKKDNADVVNVPYLLDAFYGGQVPRLMSEETKKKKALRWEQRLFRRADGIVMMRSAQNSYERDKIALEYLKKTVFLDIPMLAVNAAPENTCHNGDPKDEVVFLYAGSMPRNIRDPQNLLKMFSSTAAPNWRLEFVGPTDFESVIDEAAKVDPRIRRIGKVSYQEAQERMKSADYLVNIGNTLSYMVPSKIFDYMSLNKPIISTYKIMDDPCLPYLELYGKALAVDEGNDPQNNADLLRGFVDRMENGNHENADVRQLAQPGKPLFNNTPAAFADYLLRLISAT